MRMIYFAIFLTLISIVAASFEPLPPAAGSLANISGLLGLILLFWGCELEKRRQERALELGKRIDAFAPPLQRKQNK